MKTAEAQVPAVDAVILKKEKRKRLLNKLVQQKYLYLMILPGCIYFLLFKYVPMWGIVIAFQDYQPFLGILGSEWVGLKHFIRLFTEPTFFLLLKNTLVLFALNLVIFFPVPILLALLLNEVRIALFKKFVQTLIYIPHFMSWVIVVSLSFVLLTVDGGLINELIVFFGGEKINFLLNEEWFRPLYILQVIWREAGWSTIIYLAAITAVDPQLYEAAKMDGAGRLRQMWHITLPAIKSVIVVLLILKIGDTLELGFEHVYLLLNATNREVAEIFDTYVYTAGLKQGQFSYSTAVGVFKAAVGLILVMLANRLAKKFGEEGIY
ncbi:polygalacturonan/rhamnogalacturonan ABC transporter permease [Bacillus vallismortis]|uniref:Polygalacturonan/rhamnogalacturonan ABC transporter permease n=1 Tax=Bacillus vallismortis TaxID=72361 RepID=A0ABY4XVT1_BACVA|nr:MULTISPECIES: polygalacturonan/rhamnogalacturonan ABC transporter permease [Bacillus]MBL3646080.1 sugar ABC transporter permease [Bacillus sp. RHFS10]MDM5302916.1 polygalacturonan/rhamnogalacturonan ABC transporter permease [Bacillus subtilis]MDM5324969.1 polygalacturonan/rhamnogalacturonan ABC transporter permease [Bacillus subtilis]USP94473.1 polygalacturonan/rhamnogalacturonan ABC transporter permease [Bacillus vallismortis]